MKKALSLLLVLAMLATMGTVPVFAEDEISLDLPVIEEVTEEEMEEEIALFGEEVVDEGASVIVDIATSENDGITLLTELENSKIKYEGSTEGATGKLESLNNGKITVGNNLGKDFVSDGTTKEGAEVPAGGYFVIDLGGKMSFSGIRLYDTSVTRYYGSENYSNPTDGANRIKTADIWFSNDNKTWYKISRATAVHNAEGYYSDLAFRFSAAEGNCLNIKARYIRFEAKSVFAGKAVGFEEIVMLDPITENCPTWSLTGYEIPTSEFESVEAGSTWQKDTNPKGYPVTNAYDNNLELSTMWHSDVALGADATDEDRSITIKLKNVTKIGGVRIWPRNTGTMAVKKDATASARKVRIFGADEDGKFYPITGMSSDYHSTWNSVGYALPRDIIFAKNIDAEVKYIKIVAGYHGDNYVGIPEIQLLGDGAQKEGATGYAGDADVVPWKFLPTFKGVVNTTDNTMENTTGAFDGIVYQTMNTAEGYYNNYTGAASNDDHMGDWYVYFSKGNTSYMEFDLGKEYTFSAIRLFGRWNQDRQSFTKGYIMVGDGNGNWYRTDGYSDSYTSIGGMAKYKSTGDCYTDIPVTFGGEANITARYIRIFCEDTGGHSHWSWQELLLVKPDNENKTYTVPQLATSVNTEVANVEALIDAIPAKIVNYDEETVDVAKAAYDALSTVARGMVKADAVSKLEASVPAKAALTYSMPVTQNNGYTPVTFTIPKRENTTVKAVTYETTLGTTIDGLSATTVTPDTEGDTMTVTFAGQYQGSTGLTAHITGRNKYYGVTNSTYSWIIKGNPIVPEDYVGIFPRLVAGDGFGDHIINVTFGDGEEDVTYTFNINTTPVWTTLSGAKAIAGSDYTDEITPGTNWKVTATNGGNLTKAFDGKAEYILRREEQAAFEAGTLKSVTGNRYESSHIAGYVSAKQGEEGKNDVLLYIPVRMDFVIDMGTATTVSGARIYPRINASATYDKTTGLATSFSNSNWNVDKTKGFTAGCPTEVIYWGSNNGRSWTEIGRYQFSKDGCGERTAIFDENITCRYIKVSVLKAGGNEYGNTVSISEFVLLKPNTLLISEESVTVDISEENEASFEFDVLDGDDLASVKDASGTDVKYTWRDEVLVIDKDYVASLENGDYKFTVTFNMGAEYELTVEKKDTSKVTYELYSSTSLRGTDSLVLEKVNEAEVTGVKIVGGKDITIYTVSNDNKTITIPRQMFRRAHDLFALTDIDKDGEVQVAVTYEGGEKIYTVTLVADWSSVSGTGGVFLEDEIVPDNSKWKVRGSSVQDQNQLGNLLSKKAVGVKDYQNWHSYHALVNGTRYGDSTKEQGHWIEIDFGENPESYAGFRYVQRAGGTHWANVIITAKNPGSDTWTEIYKGSPAHVKIGRDEAYSADIYSAEMMCYAPSEYRYVRIHIYGTASEHVTGDTLHVIKNTAKLADEGISYVSENEVAEFYFVPASINNSEISVKIGETEIDAANYKFDKDTGKLCFTADYVATVADNTVFTVTIDGWDNNVTVKKIGNKLAKTYKLSDTTDGMGDDALKLYTLNGDVVTAVKYGTKTVSEYTVENGEIVIPRHIFRCLNDHFFLEDSADLKVTYETAGEVTYKVSFEVAEFTVTDASGNFEADEIEPKYGVWKVKLSSATRATAASSFFAKKETAGYNWHTAYTTKNNDGKTVLFENTTGIHYAEVDFSEETEFSGIRYTARGGSDTSGDWAAVTLSGSNDGGATWTEITPQTATGINKDSRVFTLKFDKNVSYKKVRIVIKTGLVASGKFVTFLKPEKVTVNIVPVTGGNIKVDGANVQGTVQHNPGEEVTYTAEAEEGNQFMYWIEANTGKILGYEKGLKLHATVGKNIQAVFADVGGESPYVGFFGRNGLARIASGNINKDTPLGEQTSITIPTAEKLYQTGYNFKHWQNGTKTYTAEEIRGISVAENTDFTAVYEKDEEKTYVLTVENGTIDGEETLFASFAYNTKVTVVANKAADGKTFNYWTVNGQIVSYAEEYSFYMPDFNVTIVAVYGDSKVEEEIKMSITCTKTTVTNSAGEAVSVAGFVTSRNVPEKAIILETGIIYVKDASYGELTISSVGDKSQNDKEVKVAIATKNGKNENGEAIYVSGQHKLSASYAVELGIKARGFITYLVEGAVKTIYTDEIEVTAN